MQILKMEARNQLKVKFTLALGEKEEERAGKIFYGSLFFIFLSVLGTLSAWFFKASWQKTSQHLKMLGQFSVSKFLSRWVSLEMLFLILAINLVIFGWLNKESIFPIALGKTEEQVVLGAEDAVKINDLQKESLAGNSESELLGKEKNLNLSLKEERCQKNTSEKISSELCGKDGKDEVLEQELKKIDNQARARTMAARKPVARKISCADPKDDPQKSSQGKGKHTDEDCCPDPDEYPKLGCVYSPAGYALMLKR